MPRTLTPEQQEFMQQRRRLRRQCPHLMECIEGWSARLERVNSYPIRDDTARQREYVLNGRDAYVLHIIKSFDREARQ